jgi:crossover junction endodeoxyribonuclease RuvC
VSDDGLLVLGVDPGLADTGYGAVRRQTGRLSLITCGTLKTPANLSEPQRLRLLAEQLRALIAELRPQAAAFEELFFSKNVRTAMAVGQARGVALVCAVEAGAQVHEYSPNQVKLSVTGYGGATKGQMLKMVQSVLATRDLPRSDDAIDALAVAICHHHSGRLRSIISRSPTAATLPSPRAGGGIEMPSPTAGGKLGVRG